MILPSQRSEFDIPRDVAYFNCAYMSPLSLRVLEAGAAAWARKRRPWEIGVSDFFDDSEALRASIAALFGVAPEAVVLTPSASYGISFAAANLKVGPGQRILVARDQFPSNVYPWMELARRKGAELRMVERPADGDWTGAALAVLDERVAAVALPQVHWTDGGVFDLERIGEAARQAGAALVLDLTQSAGVMDPDLRAVRPDFVAGACYKWLMGPYSVGYLILGSADGVVPLEENWIQRANARFFARLVDYTDDRLPGGAGFDAGERSNFALVPAALAGVRQVREWGPSRIAETLGARTARLGEDAVKLGCRIPAATRAPHYLALALPEGTDPIRVRDGLASRQIHVSVRGDTLRVTPHLYNDDEDETRFLGALRDLLH